MPPSARRSNPSLTTTCSSAVCDTRRRCAGGAPDSRCSPPRRWRPAVGLRCLPIANSHYVSIYSHTPQRHPPSDSDYPHAGRPRSLAAYDDSLCDLAVTATRTAARSPRHPQHSCASPPTPMPTPMHPLERVPAHRRQRRCTRSRARIRTLLVHRIIAQEWCYSAHNAACVAPATHGPLRAAARTRRLSRRAGSHTSLPPPAVASTQGSHRLFGRPFSCTPFSRTHMHARARTHARGRTTDDERRDVRSAKAPPVDFFCLASGGSNFHQIRM